MLEGNVDVGERLISTGWVGDEDPLGDSPQGTLPQPHRLLGPPALARVHESDDSAELPTVTADRTGPVFDGEVGAIAAPEDLIVGMHALAGPQRFVNPALCGG